jgi:glutaminyl-peptide cyclotransferase
MHQFKLLLLIILLFFLNSCNDKKNNITNENIIKEESNNVPKQIYFSIQNIFPHDINSFTEGFFLDKGIVYESTGSPNDMPLTKSVMGILDLKSGLIDIKSELDRNIFFGEGIAKCNDKIYQLTYKNRIGFIYNSKTFKKIDSFKFDNEEGWGLTNINDTILIMSDGTNSLTFLNTKTFKPSKKLEVFENNVAITNLNELEYVEGYIYANVYTTNKIIKIDPNSGIVVGTIDLSSLNYEAKSKFSGSLEMNGIAYNDKQKTFLITGKMWPCVYEIKLTE